MPCIIIETITTTMPTQPNKQQDKKKRQALSKAMGLKLISISPPEFIKTECAICLKKYTKENKNIAMRSCVSWKLFM